MLLSKLVYLAVKNVIYYDDKSFNFLNFKMSKFDSAPEYAQNIHNVFTPINEAIARLSDLNRIPFVVEQVNMNNIVDGVILFSNLQRKVKQIVSVAQQYGSAYRTLEWRAFGLNQIKIFDYINPNKPLFVEYKEDIPQFDEDSFLYEYNEDGSERYASDVDMSEYGITDSMCNFIMEYAEGKLNEPVAAELANMHITRAEQYFSNITAVTSAFPQREIEVRFGIGD